MDITEVIVDQHHDQRRTFAMLDDIPPHDTRTLAAVWKRLTAFLEVHAKAEEQFFYPRLLALRRGEEGDVESEVKDAIKDHNQIRDGIRKADEQEVGSDAWWDAVRATREANSDHMAEEERDDLRDFRRAASLTARHDIAVEFIRFEAEHPEGVPLHNRDPGEYVRSGGAE